MLLTRNSVVSVWTGITKTSPGTGPSNIMIGTILNLSIIFGASLFLVDRPLIWSAILLLNIPTYWVFARMFFRSSADCLWSLSNLFHGESMIATGDETWAGYRGWLLVGISLAIVTAEYKLATWLLN